MKKNCGKKVKMRWSNCRKHCVQKFLYQVSLNLEGFELMNCGRSLKGIHWLCAPEHRWIPLLRPYFTNLSMFETSIRPTLVLTEVKEPVVASPTSLFSQLSPFFFFFFLSVFPKRVPPSSLFERPSIATRRNWKGKIATLVVHVSYTHGCDEATHKMFKTFRFKRKLFSQTRLRFLSSKRIALLQCRISEI